MLETNEQRMWSRSSVSGEGTIDNKRFSQSLYHGTKRSDIVNNNNNDKVIFKKTQKITCSFMYFQHIIFVTFKHCGCNMYIPRKNMESTINSGGSLTSMEDWSKHFV